MQATAVIYCTQLYAHRLCGTVCSAQFTLILRWFFTELDFTEIQWDYICSKNSNCPAQTLLNSMLPIWSHSRMIYF